MKKLLFFFALCAFLLCGCSESSTNFSSGLQKSNFFAMDTSIEFNIYGDASLLKEAQNVLTDLESEVSVTDPDSEIYKINQDGTGTLTGNAGNLMHWIFLFIRSYVHGDLLRKNIRFLRKQRLNPFSRLLIIQRSNMILLQEMYPFQKE